MTLDDPQLKQRIKKEIAVAIAKLVTDMQVEQMQRASKLRNVPPEIWAPERIADAILDGRIPHVSVRP